MVEYYLQRRNAEAYDARMGNEADAMGDVDFYLSLAREAAAAGQSVLELGCGTGRVALRLAHAGIRVVGLDSAPPMLDVARRKAKAAGVEIAWVEADMRSFSLGERFGLVIIPFRSFLHLLSDEDQRACLRCIREHLVPGGRLAFNVFVPALLGQQPGTGRRGPVISRLDRSLPLRQMTREEMAQVLAAAGFVIEALYGWFDRRPFRRGATEMVWVARKPAGNDRLA